MTIHAEYSLLARSAFADLQFPTSRSNGVVVSDRDGIGIAMVLMKRNQRLDPVDGVSLFGIGVGAWLAIQENGANTLAASLCERLRGVASVTDQSDGYAMLRISGPSIRDALCKLVPIDLHPRAFAVGDAASTVASHISITIWRLPDAPDGSAVFEVALYRSFAASFWHALTTI